MNKTLRVLTAKEINSVSGAGSLTQNLELKLPHLDIYMRLLRKGIHYFDKKPHTDPLIEAPIGRIEIPVQPLIYHSI